MKRAGREVLLKFLLLVLAFSTALSLLPSTDFTIAVNQVNLSRSCSSSGTSSASASSSNSAGNVCAAAFLARLQKLTNIYTPVIGVMLAQIFAWLTFVIVDRIYRPPRYAFRL
ncbi:hypothetical protein [Facilibium subflavum]|uniref:hypothetical protein n=1 Tax=Facilibium subflavum TaxID=2219058 RepID=UPI000E65259F|nr:hypothetical protein [Facilibium subflavum]